MHWTYDPKPDKNEDLRQGDILEPTKEILQAFEGVHQYFTNKKYRGFLILSQTCDLVKSRCKANYINLAVIRSLQDIISDSLKKEFAYLAPGIYSRERKKMAESLIERLVNQNENALGLFYLHPEIDAGIAVHSVAILRVSISVKAELHYDKLVQARTGRLSTEFQPKLGWMVGNLYSRVGVTDWKEAGNGNHDRENKVIQEILSFAKRDQPLWLNESVYKKVVKENPKFLDLSESEQDEVIKSYLPPHPKEEILNMIANTVKNVVPKVSDQHLETIKTRLGNDDRFASKLRKYGTTN